MSQDQFLHFTRKITFGGNASYYWTCAVILTEIVIQSICVEGTLTAESCPATRLLWEKRAGNFTCDRDQGFAYHCILDDGGRLIETCLVRIKIPQGKGGCPEATIIGSTPIHSDDNSECPRNNDNCPSANIAYFSDQLYIYPICFLNASDRANYTGEAFEKSEATTETKEEDDKIKYRPDVSSINHSTAIIILVIGFALSLIANGIMCFFRYGGENKNGFIRLQKLLCTKKN